VRLHARSVLYSAAARLSGRRVSVLATVDRGARMHGRDISVRAYAYVGARSYLRSEYGAAITIEEAVDIGPECLILTVTHDIGGSARRAGPGRTGSVRIGRGSWLGARVTVLPGTVVGDSCVVGASSLLEGVYPPNSLIAGTPARVVRALDRQ
jgi:maltose O-acetyltransferase